MASFTTRPEIVGNFGVVASTHWIASGVGMRMLERRLSEKKPSDHELAHLGAMTSACHTMRDVLDVAAREIDADPGTPNAARALHVRTAIEAGCQDVLVHCGRASGSSALVFDHSHGRRAADLVVYLRQHHAERDLAELGRLALCSK